MSPNLHSTASPFGRITAKRLLLAFSTGYGQHGDYVFGWKDNFLQHAMDNKCFGPTCSGLSTQTFDKANKCTVKKVVKEDTDGCEYHPVSTYLPKRATRGRDETGC